MSKQVPSFWWDLHGDNMVIVECSDDRYPVVGKFYYDPKEEGRDPTPDEIKVFESIDPSWKWEGEKVGCAERAIKEAQKLVEDLQEGRVTIKQALKNIITLH